MRLYITNSISVGVGEHENRTWDYFSVGHLKNRFQNKQTKSKKVENNVLFLNLKVHGMSSFIFTQIWQHKIMYSSA